MIHINLTPREYHLLATYAGSEVGEPLLASAGAGLLELWGEDYIPTVTGINAAFGTNILLGGSTWGGAVVTPVGTVPAPGGSTFLTGAFWYIRVRGYYIVVNPDCSFTVGWDQIRVYLNGYTEPYLVGLLPDFTRTRGPGSYDERKNRTDFAAPVSTGFQPSALTCQTMTGFWVVNASFAGGYEWETAPGSGVFQRDPLIFESNPAPGTCDCKNALPVITYGDSYTVVAPSKFYDLISDGDHKTKTCVCKSNPAATESVEYWLRSQEFYNDVTSGSIKDKRVFVGQHDLYTDWQCQDSTGIHLGGGHALSNPPQTICQSIRSRDRWLRTNWCNNVPVFNGQPCPDGGYDLCYPTGYTICHYRGLAQEIWTIPPPCTAIGDVDDLQAITGDHYIAYTSAGDLNSMWSPSTETDWQFTTNITGPNTYAGGWGRPRLARDTNERLYILAYHANQGGADILASGLYEFVSDDHGRTWATPTLVSASALFGMEVFSTDGQGLRILCVGSSLYSQHQDAPYGPWSSPVLMVDGTPIPLATAGYWFGVDSLANASYGWVLSFVSAGGLLVEYACSNKGTSWDLRNSSAAGTATDVLIRTAIDGPLIRIVAYPDSGTTGPATLKGQYKPNVFASWPAAVTMIDEAAANLHTAGSQFGFDHASEGPDRWSISFVPFGIAGIRSYFVADKALSGSWIP